MHVMTTHLQGTQMVSTNATLRPYVCMTTFQSTYTVDNYYNAYDDVHFVRVRVVYVLSTIIPLSTKTNCNIWKFLITPSSLKNHPTPTAMVTYALISTCNCLKLRACFL